MAAGTRRLRALAASGVVVGLALAACSSGGSAEEEHVGPLDAYLDEIGGEWDEDALIAQVEELVAACMTEAGFEYVPVTRPTGVVSGNSPVGLGTREFAEEFGYAYTFESSGPGTGTTYWPLPPGEESPAEQANRAYVESLSDAAEQEYNTALSGDFTFLIDPDTDPEKLDHGCLGRASLQVNETNATPEFAEEVLDALNDLLQLVEEDPRVTDATRAWSGCMAEAGYPGLTIIQDAENLVNDRVNDFMIANFPRMDPEYDEIKASAPEEFAALQAEEVAVAVADATCREDAGYNLTYQEVSDEYEQAVVDQYREELEAWVEVAREQKAAQ